MTTTNDGGPVHPMVVKAARAMCRKVAEAIGVSFESYWAKQSDAYLIQAYTALTECGALECLEALDWCVAEINRDSPSVLNARKVMSAINGSAPE